MGKQERFTGRVRDGPRAHSTHNTRLRRSRGFFCSSTGKVVCSGLTRAGCLLSYLSLQGGGGGGSAGGSFASASVLTRLDTPLVVRNSGLLANVELQRMCKLSDECAAQILAPPTAVVKRAFFPTVEDSYVYCGYPSGYREAAKVPSLEDRFVLRRNETWETNWEDLRHLPLPGACMDSVRNLEFEPQGGPGTPATVEEDKLTVEGAKQGTLDLTVPLLELRDVFFGGQYLPFTKHYAYVPLATAEEFGGFTQGLYPANRHKFTERGPIADYPPEQCCFKYVNWATDERGELNRELEAIQWMDSENLAAAPVIVLEGPTLVAHGGGWGDYQGGGGDNYFHMLQTLASVSFLLPQLKSDPDARLLIRICKDPWAKLKKKFFDKTYKHKVEVSEGKEVKSFFECGVEQYALELLEILGIPLQQVVHYPYDEHDPTFSSLSYRFDSRNYQKFGPVVKVSKALIQPPHVQHDAQLAELRDLFKASPLLAHLPFAKHAIVVVNRNDLFKVKVCKRCVPDMDEFVVQLKSEFEPLGFAVVEVFGTEPYAEQVKAFRSAAAVLAPHGAALTSMLHCPRGAAVFEFMHASNVNRMWFMIMAAKLGLNYWNVMSHEPAVVFEGSLDGSFEKGGATLIAMDPEQATAEPSAGLMTAGPLAAGPAASVPAKERARRELLGFDGNLATAEEERGEAKRVSGGDKRGGGGYHSSGGGGGGSVNQTEQSPIQQDGSTLDGAVVEVALRFSVSSAKEFAKMELPSAADQEEEQGEEESKGGGLKKGAVEKDGVVEKDGEDTGKQKLFLRGSASNATKRVVPSMEAVLAPGESGDGAAGTVLTAEDDEEDAHGQRELFRSILGPLSAKSKPVKKDPWRQKKQAQAAKAQANLKNPTKVTTTTTTTTVVQKVFVGTSSKGGNEHGDFYGDFKGVKVPKVDVSGAAAMPAAINVAENAARKTGKAGDGLLALHAAEAKYDIPAYHTSTSAGVNSAYSNIDVDELVRALRAALLHEEVPGTVNAPPAPG